MKHYKAIVLVLASHDSFIYKEFREIYRCYLDLNPDIKVFLLYGSSASFTPQSYDLVFPEIPENYWPGMIQKTVQGLKFIDEKFNYNFLVRTNLSTFWVWDRLLKRLSSLPTSSMYTGCYRRCFINGKKSSNYISGTSLILSRDIVKLLLQKSDTLLKDKLPEDYVISNFLSSQGLKPFNPSLKTMQLLEHLIEFNDETIMKEIKEADTLNKDHFRIKSSYNREIIDPAIAKKLLSNYYNRVLV